LRPSTSSAVNKIEEKLEENLLSVDDEQKNWNFSHFTRVMSEMPTETTSVGSILAAMVF